MIIVYYSVIFIRVARLLRPRLIGVSVQSPGLSFGLNVGVNKLNYKITFMLLKIQLLTLPFFSGKNSVELCYCR